MSVPSLLLAAGAAFVVALVIICRGRWLWVLLPIAAFGAALVLMVVPASHQVAQPPPMPDVPPVARVPAVEPGRAIRAMAEAPGARAETELHIDVPEVEIPIPAELLALPQIFVENRGQRVVIGGQSALPPAAAGDAETFETPELTEYLRRAVVDELAAYFRELAEKPQVDTRLRDLKSRVQRLSAQEWRKAAEAAVREADLETDFSPDAEDPNHAFEFKAEFDPHVLKQAIRQARENAPAADSLTQRTRVAGERLFPIALSTVVLAAFVLRAATRRHSARA